MNPDLVETSFGGSSGRKCRDLAQRNSTAIGRHCLEADADKAFVKAVELVLGYREGAKCRNSKRGKNGIVDIGAVVSRHFVQKNFVQRHFPNLPGM